MMGNHFSFVKPILFDVTLRHVISSWRVLRCDVAKQCDLSHWRFMSNMLLCWMGAAYCVVVEFSICRDLLVKFMKYGAAPLVYYQTMCPFTTAGNFSRDIPKWAFAFKCFVETIFRWFIALATNWRHTIPRKAFSNLVHVHVQVFRQVFRTKYGLLYYRL